MLQRKSTCLLCCCLVYAAIVVVVLITTRFVGERWWIVALVLIVPRWIWAVPLAVLWPWALVARRRMWLVVGLMTIVVAVALMGLQLSLPARGRDANTLRLLTCNIHRQHLDANALAAVIDEVKPDLVALQDWSSQHQETLFHDGQWTLRRDGELLLASRWPITSARTIDLAGAHPVQSRFRMRDGAAACYEIQAPRGRIHLINLHLASPHAAMLSLLKDGGEGLRANSDRRRTESRAVRDFADQVPGPLLLAGDFNTPADGRLYREAWDRFNNAFAVAGNGFGYTYVSWRTQLRIDHILAGPGWRVRRCWLGPNVGSPHRPLIADLELSFPATGAN